MSREMGNTAYISMGSFCGLGVRPRQHRKNSLRQHGKGCIVGIFRLRAHQLVYEWECEGAPLKMTDRQFMVAIWLPPLRQAQGRDFRKRPVVNEDSFFRRRS